MAYTTGELIQAQDYNWLTWGGNTSGTYTTSINNLAVVWGHGTGLYGYGQDVSAISALSVAGGVTATAAQWSGFVYHLNKTLNHQGQTPIANGSNVGIVAGATIAAYANVATAVNTVVTNKDTFASQGSTTTGGNLDDAISSTTGLAIATNYDVKLTFASAQAARYFFNAGGQLNYRIVTVDGGGSGAESSVDRLITGIGGVDFKQTTNGGRTGSGITLDTNLTTHGYFDNTTSATIVVQVTDTTAAYTDSYGRLSVFTDDATTTDGSKGATVVFRINLYVSDVTWDDTISMTLRHRVDIVYPETTYLATTWGTPTSALA